MRARKILVLNGPNLDMLGMREPEIYGSGTLESLEYEAVGYGQRRGVEVACRQSNSEGELVEIIHAAHGRYDGIVYNPGAHTHYSYALRDAVASIDVPVVEVHLSAINDREAFRKVSVIAPACIAQIKGLGINGYCRAIDILCEPKDHDRLGEGFDQTSDESIIVGSEKEPSPAPSPTVDRNANIVEGHAVFSAPATATMATADQAAVAGVASTAPADPASPSGSVVASSQVPSPEPAVDAGTASPSEAQHESGASSVRRESACVNEGGDPHDYAADYAGAVASVDAGMLSFERQAVVRRACERLGLGSLLVRDTSNVRWITALDGVFDEERAHGLLMTQGRALLHTDSRYANAVRSAASRVGSDIVVNDDRTSHARFAFSALTQNGSVGQGGKLGIEDTITYAEFVKMVECFKTDGLAPTTELVVGLRSVKDAGEITRLRAAQAVTDAAFSYIVNYMKPGMTEREVQLELEDFMVRHGAEGLAFRSIVATGPNGADPHAIPGNTRLEAGQCVVMDFGAKAYGYCSDMTRTVFLGSPEGQMVSAWETLRRANEAVEAMIKPGVTGASAHHMAEQVLEAGGFGGKMGHGVGHGVGLDVHELPVLNPRNDKPLVEGNVVTVEPGIYFPGKFGMRLEDFGVVTAGGFDVFTQSTHEMVII